MVYQYELEFSQSCPRVLLGLSKQPRQVCCVCVGGVWVGVYVCARARARISQIYFNEYLSVSF